MTERMIDTAREGGFPAAAAGFEAALGDGRTLRYGVGCAWLGRRGTDDAIRKDADVLRTSYELGFRYFDTSMQYGESELVAGRFLESVDRRTVFLATKTHVPSTDSPERAAETVRRNLERSLRRLGTDYIDLYQIHDVGSLANILGSDGAMRALEEAKAAGIIRWFGLATRDLSLLATAARQGFDTVLTYSDYTPIDRSASELIETVAKDGRGVGVINASPLSAGLLAGADPASAPRTNDPEIERRRIDAIALYRFCRDEGVSVRALALQFPLRQRGIHMNLTGPASADEIKSTVEALLEALPPDVWRKWLERDGFGRRERAGGASARTEGESHGA